MSTKSYTQALAAGVPAIFPNGSVFMIQVAAAALAIVATTLGNAASDTEFSGVGAGFKFKAADGDAFDRLVVTSAVNQNVTLLIGDDDVDIANAVTVTGIAVTQDNPSSTVVDQASLGAGTVTGQHALCAANASRRRIRFFSDPANTATVYVRSGGGANDLGFLQPGTDESFATTAALDYRDPSAGGQKLYAFEEQ